MIKNTKTKAIKLAMSVTNRQMIKMNQYKVSPDTRSLRVPKEDQESDYGAEPAIPNYERNQQKERTKNQTDSIKSRLA